MIMPTGKYISLFRTLLLLCLALLMPVAAFAKKNAVQKTVFSAEERQRFYYYFYAAEWAYNNERYDDAYKLFCFCYEIDNTDPIVNQFLGDCMNAMKQPEYAIPYYRRSLDSDPLNEAVYYRLEQTYISVGMYDNALCILDKEERLRGKDTYSAYNRYRIYAMKGDTKNALKTVERYLKNDPSNMQFLLYRAELYAMMNKPYKKQKEAYESILEQDYSNTMVLNNYAYLLATHKGDLNLAEELSREAVKREPDNCTYLDTYAWILHLRGEKKLAQFYMMQTMKCIVERMPKDLTNKEIQSHYKIIMEQK